MILGDPIQNCPQNDWDQWCDCTYPSDLAANARCKARFGQGGFDFGLIAAPWTGNGAAARNIAGPQDTSYWVHLISDPLGIFKVKSQAVPVDPNTGLPIGSVSPSLFPTWAPYALAGVAGLVVVMVIA